MFHVPLNPYKSALNLRQKYDIWQAHVLLDDELQHVRDLPSLLALISYPVNIHPSINPYWPHFKLLVDLSTFDFWGFIMQIYFWAF